MKHQSLAALLCAAALLTTGCEKKATEQTSDSSGAATASWLLASAPADAMPVGEIKQTAAEGDAVVMRGRLGGLREPISEGSPVFIVVDPAIPSCAEMGEEDHCPTPWDYCCEPRDSLTANSATVQLVGADGVLLETDVAASLEPLDEIIVVGTVGPRPSPNVLTIKATAVHVVNN